MYGKHPQFIVRTAEPFNGGPPLPLLVRDELTPVELLFVRNHAPVPEIETYRLRVEGLVEQPLTLSLDELQALARVELEATLQCAGNRRAGLMAVKEVPDEVPWGDEAVGHARWGGVPLRAVLERAGLRAGAAHVAFLGLDRVEKEGRRFGFGGSIPLKKALGEEVLLADSLNGAPLPAVHGGPLRVVVPGVIGARSVKWLEKITVQEAPSDNPYQARAYRLFPAEVGPENVAWEQGTPIGEFPVNAAIAEPAEGQLLPAGPVRVRGYALAGGQRAVVRVELSADGGRTWVQARLSRQKPWSWRLWQAELVLEPGEHVLVARAWDEAGHVQPPDPAELWNFKGYLNHARPRVRLRVR